MTIYLRRRYLGDVDNRFRQSGAILPASRHRRWSFRELALPSEAVTHYFVDVSMTRLPAQRRHYS